MTTASSSAPQARVPEILAPAGSLESFATALGSGADVVFLGLSEGWNARARSAAFDLPTLPELVARAHRAGVKVYLTVNTLVFEDELDAVEAFLRRVIAAGVDALIVQDPAVAFIAHTLCPELRLHASTQMTISSAEGARFAATLGISRVVLPRELSEKEVARFVEQSPMEAEVFVHGALCMSWSGQCLTSEAMSGRSANRGQCSQACRMPYALVVDGEPRELGDTRYLLSPQDLAAHDSLEALMAAGVHGFKIEGRYKNAAYVSTAVDSVRNWRDALQRGATDQDRAQLRTDVQRTQLTFSRGASPGFLRGDDHQALVVGRSPKHRGIYLGRARALRGQRVRIDVDSSVTPELRAALRAGMGVMFDVGDPEDDDAPGGPIFGVRFLDAPALRALDAPAPRAQLELSFGDPGPDLSRVREGHALWLTGDPELQQKAQRRASTEPRGRIALTVQVQGALGQALSVQARADFAGRALLATARSSTPLQAARAGGLDHALLTDKLCALGGTPFRLDQLTLADLPAGLHLPVSELKQLRRELVSALEVQLTESSWQIAHPEPCVPALRARLATGAVAGWVDEAATPRLIPLCRTEEQLDAVIASGLCDEVELDWMELVGLARAVDKARANALRVTLATVRVQKPGEETYDRRIAALAPEAVLVRHWGALMHFAEPGARDTAPEVHGDFSLNVTNAITAQHLLGLGLRTVTASHDLDRSQLLALLAHTPRGRVAITLHHHISTFHNSHCVYAHLLSDGSDYRTCGRPCEEHRVALRDFAGLDHPVLVDVSCRNTVFNARAQSAAPLLPQLLELGVQRLRVELVWETGEQVARTLRAYRDLLDGKINAAAAMRSVGVHEQYGVTTLRR